jgi:large subunit ribosomal protein L25
MQLTVSKREEKPKKLRRNSKIPAVLYGAGKENEHLVVDRAEYEAHLRKLKEGEVLTTVFELKLENEIVKAVIKDVPYHRTTYKIEHIDFLRLSDDVKVKLRVPIRFTGSSDCVGVKSGGVLKQAIRSVKVICLPKDIPSEVYIDVSDIGLLENKSLAHVKIPENVKPLISLNEVVAIVAKR